ncbi:MAG: hypothetical protein VKN72_20485 [Nostocales cyanobacterium 94392]|nr:hypothetical protein [Nostocales cyanobacterium 94392]
MLNIKSKLFVAAAVVAGTFGLSSSAFAGEAGVAGSASFKLTTGAVTEASVAVAVGKSTAYAGATTETATGTEAFAGGSGGAMTITNLYITSIAEESATGLAIGQANELDDNDVNIDVIGGTADVVNTAP